jgi:hypothetical protein
MPTSWKEMSVANLRDIARSYRNLHSLGNISKQTKATLIETLSKVMEWKAEQLYTKKEHGGTKVATYAKYEGDIVNTHDKKPQPKKAEKADMLFENDAKKKSVKKAISQAKSASEDAKKIAPPSQKEVERATLSRQLALKARNQVRSASKDAKKIAPPSQREVERMTLASQIIKARDQALSASKMAKRIHKPSKKTLEAVMKSQIGGEKEDDAKKKSVEKAISQAKSASKDAKKIAPPSQREVEERHLLHNITKARNQAVSASKDAKKIAPPSKEEVEKLMLEKQIQSLPPELQNEIFKKLPENLQGKALGKTDEDMGAEFIKKRLPKAQLKTRADVKDFIYELMGVDEEFERDHYEDLTERTNNDFNYEYGNAEGMSERRFQKLFERTDEKIFREKMNEYKTILIDGRKEKASPSVIRTRLIGTFWG